MTDFDKKKYIDAIYNNLKGINIHKSAWKNTFVIGDVHFGIKSNSILWLEKQLEFFRLQVIPIIENADRLNIDNIVFLGDLFDIRYSTNTYIGIEVKKLFREINGACEKSNIDCHILAGNHDYYSPDEKFIDYNVYELVFGPEFMRENRHICFRTKTPIILFKNYKTEDGKSVVLGNVQLLPWYCTENKDNLKGVFKDIMSESHDFVHTKAIYAHWDLENNCDHDTHQFLKEYDIAVYSGHIHYLWKDENYKLYNVGACCQFTFGDANQDRYIYIVNENENKQISIKNIVTPKFIILYNEDIFDDNIINTFNDNMCVDIRILSKYKETAKYKERLKYIKSNYINTNIKISVISDDNIFENSNNTNIVQSNVEQYIEDNTPVELKENLGIIVNKLKDNK